MEISVAFATDENYLFYTVVAITSMAENAKENTFYQIYILLSGELEKGHRLLTEVEKKYSNIKINLLPVKEYKFRNVYINNSHVTKTTFYRLLLGELLQVDKCLYLDSDIVVNTDLQELWTVEINSEYIAGVRDLWIDLIDEPVREQRRLKSKLPSLGQYVNAGVVLFNLKKIRQDRLTERFCEHMKIDYPYEDQDIINVCCYGHIMRLPAKWNLFTVFMGQAEELEQKGIDKETIRQMKAKSGILHYATIFIRPWESERFLCNDLWWDYAKLWSETPEYRRLRERMRQREIGYSEEKLALYCTQYERVYIWGFTELGRRVFGELSEKGVDNIVCFIDHDDEKQKFTYSGKEVRPFDSRIYNSGKSAFIIVSQKRGKEIQEFLLTKGICENDIVCYIFKNEVYYQCLRPEYQKDEK